MGYRFHNSKKTKAARAVGLRSGLEVGIVNDLNARGAEFKYEPLRIPYFLTRIHHYKPDVILANGVICEGKGQFKTADRTKHLMIREQSPELDIRFVFSNPNSKISKTSKTTYADWCRFKAFRFATKTIPQEWIDEPANSLSLAALEKLKK